MKQLALAAEKIGTTYVEAVITLLLLGNIYDTGSVNVALVAAVPAGLTAMLAFIPQPNGLPFYLDVLYRTGRTYAVTFIGFLVAMPVFAFDMAQWKAFAIAAVPAALTILKSALASKVGVTKAASVVDNPSAAILPFKLDPAARVDFVQKAA